MKIVWLNSNFTEAIITRGWWIWKKQAHVTLPPHDEWRYATTGNAVEEPFRERLVVAYWKRIKKSEREASERSNWQRVSDLPRARILERIKDNP